MTELPIVHVVAAAIVSEGRCLIGRRPRGGSAGELWEFPGGKVEPGETPQIALAREIREELCVEIEVGLLLGRSEIRDARRHLILDLFLATWKEGNYLARAHLELSWVDASLRDPTSFAPADRPLLPLIASHLARAR